MNKRTELLLHKLRNTFPRHPTLHVTGARWREKHTRLKKQSEDECFVKIMPNLVTPHSAIWSSEGLQKAQARVTVRIYCRIELCVCVFIVRFSEVAGVVSCCIHTAFFYENEKWCSESGGDKAQQTLPYEGVTLCRKISRPNDQRGLGTALMSFGDFFLPHSYFLKNIDKKIS